MNLAYQNQEITTAFTTCPQATKTSTLFTRAKVLLQFAFLLLISSLLLANGASAQATVKTDKLDYFPGEYVIITGTGWQPGETVSFRFEETPKPATCVNPHDLVAIADVNGNIYNNQFLIRENHLGVHFVLTATGLTSGRVAITEFDDATYNFTTDKNSFCPSSTSKVKFTIEITNGSQPNKFVTVVVPPGYSISNPGTVTYPSLNIWTVTLTNSTTVCLTGASALANNDIITFLADVTAPSAAGGPSPITGRANPDGSACSTISGQLPTNTVSFTTSSTNCKTTPVVTWANPATVAVAFSCVALNAVP